VSEDDESVSIGSPRLAGVRNPHIYALLPSLVFTEVNRVYCENTVELL
jgi:hypothetical protein